MSAPKKAPWISSREWKVFWIATLILALVSGGITALSTWLGRPEEPKNVLPAQSPFKDDVADTIPQKILLTDFDLPAPGGQWLSKTWLYSREGGNRPWTVEDIAPFWVPSDKVPLLALPEENAKAIETLFRGVR